MIRIVDIGMNHETAPVEVRELLSIGKEELDKTVGDIQAIKTVKESMVLSTCNRVEILFTSEREKEAKESIIQYVSQLSGISKNELKPLLYIYNDQEAIRHIFRVGSSLDSMIIGEPQILGQLKDAYRIAVDHKSSSVTLNRLMHRTFALAKRIRTNTGIAGSPVSISFAAVELAKKIFGELKNKGVLLIGAGEMAELAASYLLNNKIARLRVANRTFSHAVALAEQLQGMAISFDEIESHLLEVDIVVSSTASPEPIISFDQIRRIMKSRKNRPLFFIDIAVPRDVESRVNELDNVFVYDIDDLRGIINDNMSKRQAEAVKAERMVDEEVIKFTEWLRTLEVVPTIRELQEKCERIYLGEIEKTLSSLKGLTAEQKKGVEKMAHSITKKLLNDPIIFLKRKGERSSRDLYLDFTRQLFNLDGERRGQNKSRNNEDGHH
ncbi:MAG: glutamyl-tRNA reductase [Thermodesulfobacteriota bacterium]